MELVYAALLLHSIGKQVDEESVKKVVTSLVCTKNHIGHTVIAMNSAKTDLQ